MKNHPAAMMNERKAVRYHDRLVRALRLVLGAHASGIKYTDLDDACDMAESLLAEIEADKA